MNSRHVVICCLLLPVVGIAGPGCQKHVNYIEGDLPPGEYSILVGYDFAGFIPDASTCADAWMDDIFVTLQFNRVRTTVLSFRCDDTPILIEGVAAGTFTVSVASVEDPENYDGAFAASEAVDVQTGAGPDPAEVDLTLECDANGVQDGCGGG